MTKKTTAATAAPFTGRFFPAHAEKLKACGIPEQAALAAGISSVTASHAADVLGFSVPGDALELTYRSLGGEDMVDDMQLPFVRYRIFDPRPDVAEEMRYLSRRDSGSRPYLPAGLAELLPSAKHMVFTEGELKALSAVANGLACAAIAGVTMWAAPERGMDRLSEDTPVHPELIDLARRVGRVVVLADSDGRQNDEVKHNMETFAAALSKQAPDVLVVYKACPSPKQRGLKLRKMGLDDWIAAKTVEDADSFVYRALQDEEKRRKRAAMPNAGFIPLGYSEGSVFHIFSLARSQVDSLTPTELSRPAQLKATVGPVWAGATYRVELEGGKTMTDFDQLSSDIIQSCIDAGLYREGKARGAGVWCDDGRLIVNGANLWSPTDPAADRITPSHIYLKTRDLEIVQGTPAATDAEVQDVAQALGSFSFARKTDARLVLGLVMLGFVCGALHWRPHTFIQAEPHSGKSTLMLLLSNLLGGAAFLTESRSVAGLRQELRSDAIVSICDELEADIAGLEELFAFFRISAGGGSKSLGTQDHTGIRFLYRSMGIMAGVRAPKMQGADTSRFLCLMMHAPMETVKRNPHHMLIKKSPAAEARARAAGAKLCARMLTSWGLFLATHDAIVEQLTSDGRVADVMAPIFAACYVAEHSTPCTDVAGYIAGFDIADDIERMVGASESGDFVEHLLSTAIPLQLDGKRIEKTVGTAITEALVDGQTQGALGMYGIKPVIEGGVVLLHLATKNPQLAGIFRGTRWEKTAVEGIAAMVKKIPGADRKIGDQRTRFVPGGASVAYIAMPLHGFEIPDTLKPGRTSSAVNRAYGVGTS